MQENTMPAIEVGEEVGERELAAYELAFHVLPTVAEGEVAQVAAALKQHIIKAGGHIFDEEVPQRFDLAYEIVKYLEGRNRSFSSAYFGWIRFHLEPHALEQVVEGVATQKELLRYLMVRLTKTEEAMPFRFHEAIAQKRVVTIGDEEVVDEVVVAEVEEADAVVPIVDGEEKPESV